MPQGPITVFLADDDADDTAMFCEALQEVDSSVACTVAENGKRAIELLSHQGRAKPAVIFLDINMPVLNGWDCLQWIKSNPDLSDIPVIMYSTSSSKRDADRSAQHGALCLMSKPETYSGLKAILQTVTQSVHDNLPAALRTLPNVAMQG